MQDAEEQRAPALGDAKKGKPQAPSGAAPAGAVALSSEAFGLNFPVPCSDSPASGAATACIVKLYDEDAERVRVGDTVELIGVLCINPEGANFESDAWDPQNACDPSTAFVPRLHVLHIRHLPFYNPLLPFTPAWLTEARLASAWQARFAEAAVSLQLREAAMAELARHCGGDRLAAEYILLLLASRTFANVGLKALGSWSLNIACGSHALDAKAICGGIGELVPR
eukprot:1801336-Amphidinium_carterae.1